MTKTLERLVEKAEVKGFAKLNGRMTEWGGYSGPLEEKYSIKIKNNLVTLKHWGTETLTINTDTKKVVNVYGQSVTDRDSVNFVLNYFNLPYHVHFFPSRDEFELHADATDEVLKVI